MTAGRVNSRVKSTSKGEEGMDTTARQFSDGVCRKDTALLG
jgi:hypothetical protein